MNNWRLWLNVSLTCTVLLVNAPDAHCQVTSIQCNQTFSDDAHTGQRMAYDNRTQGCNLWTLQWFAETSSPTLELDGANDVNGVPGNFNTGFFSPTSLNANPIGLQTGIMVLHGYAPWIAVKVTKNVATGVTVILRGIYSTFPEGFAMTQAGTGIPIIQCDNATQVLDPVGTTVRAVAANVNFFFTHICGFILTADTAASKAIIGYAPAGMCGSGITVFVGTYFLNAGGVVSIGAGLGSLAEVSNSFDVCVSSITGSVDGTIIWNQNNFQ